MVRIAHVGCGYWGKNLVRNFSELGALAAVVDGHEPTRRAMSETYGVPALDWDAVLGDDGIDCVSLATPAESHADMAITALTRGKHVYVEKPLALTVADCDRIIAAAKSAGRTLMVGHLMQYHPIFIAMVEKVRGGMIGDLRYVYSNRMSLGKFRIEENVLWSFAPHDISMLLKLAGGKVTHVEAQGASFVSRGIADWCTTQLAFDTGIKGHVQVSWLHPFKEQRLVAIGSKGMLVFEDSLKEWDKKLAFYPHVINTDGPVPLPQAAPVEYLPVHLGEPLKAECQHFITSVEQGTQPVTDGAEGRAVLDVLSRAEAKLSLYLSEH